jgi:hypothetical protein
LIANPACASQRLSPQPVTCSTDEQSRMILGERVMACSVAVNHQARQAELFTFEQRNGCNMLRRRNQRSASILSAGCMVDRRNCGVTGLERATRQW